MLFKILKGNSSRISTEVTPFHDGWAYFTSDDSGFYIDCEDGGVQKRHRVGLRKFCAGNPAVTASNGVFTWKYTASTHGISDSGLTVQVYDAATGAMVLADVTVSPTTYEVTITINDTAGAGTLAAGTYRVVIVG